VFGGDQCNVVQAIHLSVHVVNGNDGDLDSEQVGDLAGEGADAEMRTRPPSRAWARSRETEDRDICRWRAIVSIVCPWR